MNGSNRRPALPADLDRIAEIYADAVANGTASYELEPPDRAEMAARFTALGKEGFPHLADAA